MKTITFNLSSNALRAVALFASHDTVRYAMNSVLLEYRPTNGGNTYGLLVATDGRRIGCCSAGITSGVLGCSDSLDVIIPLSLIKFIRKTDKEITLVLQETEKLPLDDKVKRPLFRITIEDGSPIQKSAMEIDGTFPNWRQAVPKEIKSPVSSIYLNPLLLSDFCKAQDIYMTDFKSLRSMLITNSGGEESPILISFNGCTGKFFGIIMPLRVGSKEDTTMTIPSYTQEGAK